MASSSGASTGSQTTNSGSDGDLKSLISERKRKRMISNRESARRSRMKKQKHLDDLRAQLAQLRTGNQQIMTRVNITTRHYLNVEAENAVLRAQANELSHRLQSLTEIIGFIDGGGGSNSDAAAGGFGFSEPVDSFFNPLNCLNQPIMASADNMFQY